MVRTFRRGIGPTRLSILSAALCTALAGSQVNAQQSVSANQPVVDKHSFDGSASFCGGDNVLFYNGRTGQGLVGKVSRNGFQLARTFRAGDFRPGWTHAARVDSVNSILFYNMSSGAAALGTLDHGDFHTSQNYDNFSRGWTHVLYVGLGYNHALFYNSASAAAVLGFAPSLKTYRSGDFAAGWSHIVWNRAGTLFYDTGHGSGAIVQPIVSGSPGPFAAPNDLHTTVWFKRGSFTTQWTHVAATQSHILFYNRNDGSAAIGTLSQSGFETRRQYTPGLFSAEWTHVLNTGGDTLLFYNSVTGSAAIGEIVGDEFRTTTTFGPNSFAQGFSLVVCGADGPSQPH